MPKRGKKAEDGASGDEPEATVPEAKKIKKVGAKGAKEKAAEGPILYQDPPNKLISPSGQKYTLKITSWNVDGLRAWVKKKGLEWVREEDPDVLCLQETKCAEKLLPPEVQDMPEYPHKYWACAGAKEGYSGVALLCKTEPLSVAYGIGEEEHDQEGRVITAEFPSHFVVTAYVPNAGRGLVRLGYRQRWDAAFRAYLRGLDARKPLVLCGDLNVAHAEIDLKNPKGNKKSAGFTLEERQGFGELLAAGFTDTFRHLYPTTPHAYTFWTYMMNSRAKNVGWRLDYFLLSARLLGTLCDSKIRSQAMGSDHCPVTLYLAL
uniref:DNA repair nuclease/redox regulator APEX1 n=1 Tax=Pelusios castaneus TaxID=367368 RepID=A0A8C8RXT6_9SAUR